MARFEVDIYNGDDEVSCMERLEVDIFNGRLSLVMSGETWG
jgi:hypothetical protein